MPETSPIILHGTGNKPNGTHPCDIFESGATPCVAAHSMMRALYAAYSGPIYQVIRASDNTSLDIKTIAPGGPANAAAQDTFCKGTSCIVAQFYDQSPHGNHIAKYLPTPGNTVETHIHLLLWV